MNDHYKPTLRDLFPTLDKEPNKERLSRSEKAPVARRSRKKRNRAFNYRGFTFYTFTEDGLTKIFSLDSETRKMEHQATVPQDMIMLAVRELVKMRVAWRELKRLSVPKTLQGEA